MNSKTYLHRANSLEDTEAACQAGTLHLRLPLIDPAKQGSELRSMVDSQHLRINQAQL